MSFFDKLKKNIRVKETRKSVKSDKEHMKEKENSNKEKTTKKIITKKIKLEKEVSNKKERNLLSSEKSSLGWLKPEGELTVDVYQTDSEFCIESPIAGVDINDMDILIENDMLIIRGKREEEYKDIAFGDENKNDFVWEY